MLLHLARLKDKFGLLELGSYVLSLAVVSFGSITLTQSVHHYSKPNRARDTGSQVIRQVWDTFTGQSNIFGGGNRVYRKLSKL